MENTSRLKGRKIIYKKGAEYIDQNTINPVIFTKNYDKKALIKNKL